MSLRGATCFQLRCYFIFIFLQQASPPAGRRPCGSYDRLTVPGEMGRGLLRLLLLRLAARTQSVRLVLLGGVAGSSLAFSFTLDEAKKKKKKKKKGVGRLFVALRLEKRGREGLQQIINLSNVYRNTYIVLYMYVCVCFSRSAVSC